MKNNFFIFLASFLFGAGLELAQMTNPAKVQGFLNITRNWDPSLMFVMVGGITLNSLAFFFWIKKKDKPLFNPSFFIPTKNDISPELVIGSLLFGAGWGLAGFCPGPALSSLYRGQKEVVIIVASMLAGMALFTYVVDPIVKKLRS